MDVAALVAPHVLVQLFNLLFVPDGAVVQRDRPVEIRVSIRHGTQLARVRQRLLHVRQFVLDRRLLLLGLA